MSPNIVLLNTPMQIQQKANECIINNSTKKTISSLATRVLLHVLFTLSSFVTIVPRTVITKTRHTDDRYSLSF